MVFMKTTDDRGTLFTLADDVNIAGPPAVLAEIVAKLPASAMSEAGLTTQTSKSRVYVHPSAQNVWTSFLDDHPRSNDASILSLHDISYGRNPPLEENDDSFLRQLHRTHLTGQRRSEHPRHSARIACLRRRVPRQQTEEARAPSVLQCQRIQDVLLARGTQDAHWINGPSSHPHSRVHPEGPRIKDVNAISRLGPSLYMARMHRIRHTTIPLIRPRACPYARITRPPITIRWSRASISPTRCRRENARVEGFDHRGSHSLLQIQGYVGLHRDG